MWEAKLLNPINLKVHMWLNFKKLFLLVNLILLILFQGLEDSPWLSDFEELHQEWRKTGNIILRVYRLFEGRLNINSANSRIPEQGFEIL